MLKCTVKDWEFGIGLGCDSPPGWPCLQSRAHFLEKLPAACQKSLSTPRSLKKSEKTTQKSSDGILRFASIHFSRETFSLLPKVLQHSCLQIMIWSAVCHSGTIFIQPRVRIFSRLVRQVVRTLCQLLLKLPVAFICCQRCQQFVSAVKTVDSLFQLSKLVSGVKAIHFGQ